MTKPEGLLKCAIVALLCLCSIANPGSVLAEADWSSLTIDNDDQESMEYDNEALGVTLGITYAWENISLAFAMSDLNVLEDNDDTVEYSQFGTLTVAWKHD